MRWPVTVLICTCVALWLDALAGGRLAGQAPALLAVAALAVVVGYRVALVPTVLAGIAGAGLLLVADQVGSPHQFAIADDGVFYAVVVLAPALAGWLIGSRNRRVRVLRSRREELEATREVAIELARAEEFDRVCRRVDAVLAQRLRSVVDAVRTAQDRAEHDGAAVPALLTGIEEQTRAALGDLRRVLGVLHAAGPPDVAAPASGAADDSLRRQAPRWLAAILDAALVLAGVPLAIETALPGHRGPAGVDVALALAQGVALTLARRRLLVGLAVLLSIATLQTALFAALPPTVGWLLPGLSAAFLAGVTRSWRVAVSGLLLVVCGVCVVTVATPSGHRSVDGFLPSLVMGLLVWGAGRIAADRANREDELRAVGAELDRRRHDDVRLATVQQRAELARDLHDVGAHTLTAVCLHVGAAQMWWGRDRARGRAALDTVTTLADSTLCELGGSFGQLAHGQGSSTLDSDSLDVLLALSRLHGLDVELTLTGDLELVGDEAARVAYRVVQEALTNAARHAGATQVQVQVAVSEQVLAIRIADSGPASPLPGPAVGGSGLGLRGMRERVEAVCGQLSAGPQGGGFEVLARIPA